MLTKIDGNSAHTINSVELICNLFIEYFLNCDNKIKMPHTKIRWSKIGILKLSEIIISVSPDVITENIIVIKKNRYKA
jgi:hypothetical protein